MEQPSLEERLELLPPLRSPPPYIKEMLRQRREEDEDEDEEDEDEVMGPLTGRRDRGTVDNIVAEESRVANSPEAPEITNTDMDMPPRRREITYGHSRRIPALDSQGNFTMVDLDDNSTSANAAATANKASATSRSSRHRKVSPPEIIIEDNNSVMDEGSSTESEITVIPFAKPGKFAASLRSAIAVLDTTDTDTDVAANNLPTPPLPQLDSDFEVAGDASPRQENRTSRNSRKRRHEEIEKENKGEEEQDAEQEEEEFREPDNSDDEDYVDEGLAARRTSHRPQTRSRTRPQAQSVTLPQERSRARSASKYPHPRYRY
ncbi:MAG: hypothetical protein M1819_002490 [Sarea resinae]|nr:MAG: hypothetical protein M1819_002490 [Sarea resinae]